MPDLAPTDPALPAAGPEPGRSRAGLSDVTAVAVTLAVLAGAIAAAVVLWTSTTVPGNLHLPHLDTAREFAGFHLDRARSFEAVGRWLSLGSELVTLVALALYARYGAAAFTRESAAGPIGTGFLLGMLGLGIAWLAGLPLLIAQLWWERRHGIISVNYFEVIFGNWFALGFQFLSLCFVILVSMGFARVLRRMWWVPAAAVLVGVVALQSWLGPELEPGRRVHNPVLRADAARIAKQEGVGGVPLRLLEVRHETTEPNAAAAGMAGSRRVYVFDTITDFPRRDLEVTFGHEFGHLAHHHIAKDIGWEAVVLFPIGLIVMLLLRSRGGLRRPEAIPLALFLVVLLQFVASPLRSAASSRHEAEADWSALRTTHDPRAMEDLMRRFTSVGYADPDPPGWYQTLFGDHPKLIDRIAMARAWEARNPGTRP